MKSLDRHRLMKLLESIKSENSDTFQRFAGMYMCGSDEEFIAYINKIQNCFDEINKDLYNKIEKDWNTSQSDKSKL